MILLIDLRPVINWFPRFVNLRLMRRWCFWNLTWSSVLTNAKVECTGRFLLNS